MINTGLQFMFLSRKNNLVSFLVLLVVALAIPIIFVLSMEGSVDETIDPLSQKLGSCPNTTQCIDYCIVSNSNTRITKFDEKFK